jgi:hypothetical protein
MSIKSKSANHFCFFNKTWKLKHISNLEMNAISLASRFNGTALKYAPLTISSFGLKPLLPSNISVYFRYNYVVETYVLENLYMGFILAYVTIFSVYQSSTTEQPHQKVAH